MKELQKEIKESTISSGRVKRLYSPFMGIIYCTYQNITLIMSVYLFYRNFTPSTTKRRPSVICTYTKRSRCCVGK